MRPLQMMVGVGDVIDEKELKETLEKIKDRLQPRYTNPLKVRYHEPDYELGVGMIPGYFPYYYLVEVSRNYFLWILPRKEFRMLVAVSTMFFKRDQGLKEITAGVFDQNILDVVTQELEQYKLATHATGITIQHEYLKSDE
jgi:hypothetical protein